MKYAYSQYWTEKAREIAKTLGMNHVLPHRISCIESKGTKTRRTIARIHTLSKAEQLGMQELPFYTIELITEQFYRQAAEQQLRTIIHELMHIPHNFGGGFRHHRPYVNARTVEKHYQNYVARRTEKNGQGKDAGPGGQDTEGNPGTQ